MLGLELSVVSVILRCQPSVGALQHIGPTISRFLGPSPHLPFHYASTFGSIALLDWIWSCSCTSVATRPPEWSLANFLRSDPHYHRWEFSISVEWAASRGDLEIIKWLFTHFSDCKVPVEAVEDAVSNGQLAVLQYLLDRDTNNQDNAGPNNKKRKVTESGELVSVGDSPASTKAKQIVCWDRNEEYNTGLVKMAIDNGHIDVARWLYDNIATERNEDYVRAAIQAALNRNDLELAKSFVPPGRDVMGYVGYSVFCTRNVQVVEHMIDSGSLQRMSYIGAVAIKALVASGRLDLMQRVASLRYSPRRNNREWVDVWRGVLKSVCFRGDCAMVQWALGHPIGRQACKLLKQNTELCQLLWNAVAGGNSIEVLQTLQDSGSIDKYGAALVEAVAKNDMKSIKWLLDNFPQSERISAYCVLDEAARWGYLNILEYFQSLPSAPRFVPTTAKLRKVIDLRGETSRWSSSGTIMTVASGHLQEGTERHALAKIALGLHRRHGRCRS